MFESYDAIKSGGEHPRIAILMWKRWYSMALVRTIRVCIPKILWWIDIFSWLLFFAISRACRRWNIVGRCRSCLFGCLDCIFTVNLSNIFQGPWPWIKDYSNYHFTDGWIVKLTRKNLSWRLIFTLKSCSKWCCQPN